MVHDSFDSVLYRLPCRRRSLEQLETVPLSGDFTLEAGFNLNGIETTPGAMADLRPVQYRRPVPHRSRDGRDGRIDLGSGLLVAGDGLIRVGATLYVGRNTNVVDVVRLGARPGRGG